MGALTYRGDGQGNVLLTLKAANGFTATAKVTESYIRARAWAILADFEPDEPGPSAVTAHADEVAVVKASLAPAPTQRDRVLMALARGESKAGPISHQLGALRPSISGRLIELVDTDMVVCLQKGGGRGRAAIYGLTRAGAVRALALGMTVAELSPETAKLVDPAMSAPCAGEG